MSSSAPEEFQALACDVQVTDDELVVSLSDGRRVSAPLVWFPRLLHASPEARADWRLIGDGIGIHWSQVDEDISVTACSGAFLPSSFGLLRGAAPNESLQRTPTAAAPHPPTQAAVWVR